MPVVDEVVQPVVDADVLADAVVAAGVTPRDVPVAAGIAPVGEAAPAVTGAAAVKAAFAPAPVAPAEAFLEAANAVAETLLVTPGLLRGEGEIRVRLRPDVLAGSEIQIAVAGRQLSVLFVPQTPEVALLIEQNRPQLEQQLAAHVHQFQLSVGVVRRRAGEGKERVA